ncbi:MAG TPA: hypothetical protein PKK59_07940 [Anaerolineaceae bacterium]|nr:hypothetical protein [Anaerolineaceae bacterium]
MKHLRDNYVDGCGADEKDYYVPANSYLFEQPENHECGKYQIKEVG